VSVELRAPPGVDDGVDEATTSVGNLRERTEHRDRRPFGERLVTQPLEVALVADLTRSDHELALDEAGRDGIAEGDRDDVLLGFEPGMLVAAEQAPRLLPVTCSMSPSFTVPLGCYRSSGHAHRERRPSARRRRARALPVRRSPRQQAVSGRRSAPRRPGDVRAVIDRAICWRPRPSCSFAV
jgi:hypothetical protein